MSDAGVDPVLVIGGVTNSLDAIYFIQFLKNTVKQESPPVERKRHSGRQVLAVLLSHRLEGYLPADRLGYLHWLGEPTF